MKTILPSKKNQMKKNNPMITAGISWRYLSIVLAALLVGGFFAVSASAQGRGNGGGREGGGRQSGMREQSSRGGENRRSDVTINRQSYSRDFNRPQNTVVRERERNFSPERNNNTNSPSREINQERNSNTGSVNRDFNSNRDLNRERDFSHDRNTGSNISNDRDFNTNRTVNNYYNHPVTGTYSRPGYRSVYSYNRSPVYNAYNPCWRYGYLPKLNSYYYSLPSSYFGVSFGGIGYRYWNGVYYRPYNNLFIVTAPPIGIYINVLPVGYRRIYVQDYPYYYFNGTYYDQRGSNYYVVSPPTGAVVESLPSGYETLVIDGETFYAANGAQYKPVVQQNGEIWYKVIKANK